MYFEFYSHYNQNEYSKIYILILNFFSDNHAYKQLTEVTEFLQGHKRCSNPRSKSLFTSLWCMDMRITYPQFWVLCCEPGLGHAC